MSPPSATSPAHRLAVAALFLVIFALHALYVAVVQLPEREVRLRGKKIAFQGLRLYDDEDQYLQIAWNLARHGMLSLDGRRPTATRVPLYPLALAGTLSLPHGLTLALGLNCLLAALAALLSYFLARLFWSPPTGLLAMTLTGLSPHSFNWFLWMQAEALLAVLLLAFLIVLVQLLRTARTGYAWLAGLLAGLAALTRPETALLIPLYLVFLAYYRGSRRQPFLKAGLALALAAGLTLLPWLVRNYAVMGTPTLSTLGGFTFAGAHNDRVRTHPGSWYAHLAYAGPEELDRVEALPEPEQDRFLWRRGLSWLSNLTWREFLVLEVQKLHRTFKPSFRLWGKEFGWSAVHLVLTAPFALLYCLALTVGLVRLAREPDLNRRAQLAALVWIFLLPLAVTLIFWGNMRFRAPYEPVIFTLGAGLLTHWRGRDGQEKAPAAVDT
ncbi:MAG: hypothetical protein FJ128_10410 [Deltaproteobacteria bacterium]|nr:hypothetical protein [Deltaproteobacteria bacterium]